MNPRVLYAKYRSPYKLLLTFENDEVKEFSFDQYLSYPVYHALRDENYSSTVKVFNGTVVWDQSIDFDPDTLYLDSIPITV